MQNKIETTGELRKLLANVAVAVLQRDTKPDVAAISIKACKEINNSLYSEIKAALLQKELGRAAPALGELRISP